MTDHDKWVDVRRRLPCKVCGQDRVVGSRTGGLVCPDVDCESKVEPLPNKEAARIRQYYRSLEKAPKVEAPKRSIYLREE